MTKAVHLWLGPTQMPIVLVCHCGKKLRARDEQAGTSCKCPACGTALRVPYPMAKAIPPPPPEELEDPQFVDEQDVMTDVPAPPAPPPRREDPLDQLKAAIAKRKGSSGSGRPGSPQARARVEPYTPPGEVPVYEEDFAPPAMLPQTPGSHVAQQPGDIPEPVRGWRVIDPLSDRPPPRAVDAPAGEEVARLERTWRGHVYWILLLLCIPLVALTVAGKADVDEMLRKALEKHGYSEKLVDEEEKGDRQSGKPHALGFDRQQVEKLLSELPGHRLEGAFLARDTWLHWPIALLATVVFFALVAFAIPAEAAPPKELFAAGVFTATLGVGMLLMIQYFGACTCIGLWYIAALHPNAPFGPSLLGFVFGVGVCEEIIKCIPVLWVLHKRSGLVGWRECCLIGMASGAGFGISEGIHYCANYYNGLVGLDIYLVRFLSSCGIHVVLSGACGIMIFRKQKHLSDWLDPWDWVMTMTAIMLAPIFLHGLFDALLKQKMDAAAVGVWVASFALLAWLITDARHREWKAAHAVISGPKLIRTAKGTKFVQS
jgi:RsiW-degrading membrane proteinase PrsW (M82 family)